MNLSPHTEQLARRRAYQVFRKLWGSTHELAAINEVPNALIQRDVDRLLTTMVETISETVAEELRDQGARDLAKELRGPLVAAMQDLNQQRLFTARQMLRALYERLLRLRRLGEE